MSITILFVQLIKLFVLMCLGYLLYKTDMIDDHTRAHLTKLVLYVTTPALIIHSFVESTGNVDKLMLGRLFLIVFAIYAAQGILSLFIVLVLRVKKIQRGMYMFMTIFSNVGFMGFPVVEAIYGTEGVFYTAIFNCIFNILLFTAGVVLVNYGQNSNDVRMSEMLSLRKILNPGFLGCFVAVIIFLLSIPVHPIVNELLDSVGGLTSCLAMLLVGSSLATMNIREIFDDIRVYLYTIIKQIALPLIIWLPLKMIIEDTVFLNVCLIMVSMPVANSAVLFATEYKRDEKLAGKTIFITTVASILTIPLVAVICAGW